MPPRIGLDLIGGDHNPADLFQSLSSLAADLPTDLELVFFGPSDFTGDSAFPCRVSFCPVSETLGTESLLSAIRTKKDTSMTRAMQMLGAGELDAFISIGSTGALVGSSCLYLNRIEPIRRPALLATLPTKKNPLAVIDVGGNVNTKAEHLVQFAQMGIAYQRCRGIAKPRFALLNIGHEETKGYGEIIEAFNALQNFDGFYGNIEARNVFEGDIDILVTDGFPGNILLKTAEGMANFIYEKLPKELNYAEYPGALLCGVDGIVVKCHGYSNGRALLSGILGAYGLVKESFVEQLKRELS